MKSTQGYQAIISAPFGVLGILCEADTLSGIAFLARNTLLQPPFDNFAKKIRDQLEAYFNNPDFNFDLPLGIKATEHQNKVWQLMQNIPRGQTRQYGELARELSSSPRAVGQACGANPVPIIIPCHRVVSKTELGGFANHREGYELEIKRWLLTHEQR